MVEADISVVSNTNSRKDPSVYELREPSAHQTKSVKLTPATLDMRLFYKVIVKGVNVTPDNILDPAYVTLEDLTTHAAFDHRSRARFEAAIKYTRSKSRTGLETIAIAAGAKVYATTINLDDIEIDVSINTEEGIEVEDNKVGLAPSAFYLPKLPPLTSYPPEIFITLKETETVFLISLPCLSYEKGSREGNFIEEDNAFYDYITLGKGKNRKIVNEETQTQIKMTQTRHTLATRPQKKNAISFASMWDMLDTYAQIEQTVAEEDDDEMVMYQSAAAHMLRKKRKKIEVHRRIGKTFTEIAATHQYLDAVLLMERVLEIGRAHV